MKKKILYFIYLIVITLSGVIVLEKLSGYLLISKQNKYLQNIRYINLKEYNTDSIISVSPLSESTPPFSYTPIKTRIQTDSDGFIVTKHNSKAPDIKLFFLGGSTTECLYNSEDLRFPELTARLVEKESSLKINSYNCGIGGINSLHSINILLNKVIPNKPDYVFFMHNINDLVTLDYYGTYWFENHPRANINKFGYLTDIPTKKHSILNKVFPNITTLIYPAFDSGTKDEFKGIRKNSIISEADSSVKSEMFRRNINTFIAICKTNNITPILMTQPNAFDLVNIQWFLSERADQLAYIGNETQQIKQLKKMAHMLSVFNDIIRETAVANNCILIELEKEVNDIGYFRDEVHVNDKGSEKIAHIIAKEILQKIR